MYILQYSTAMKVRAAIAYHYISHDAESPGYHYDSSQEKWVGNPSRSTMVCRYMASLQRRKVFAGERPESMRPLLVGDIKLLYRHCGGDALPDGDVLGARQYVSILHVVSGRKIHILLICFYYSAYIYSHFSASCVLKRSSI
jgi:hypothetical protein